MTRTMRATAAEKVSLPGAIRSEWIKFRGLTSNQVIVLFTFALIVANAILMPWAYVLRDRSSAQADYNPYPEMVIDKTGYIGVILAVVGALVITNEYRSGQIKTTLLSLPRRTPVLLAKAMLLMVIAFAVGVASAGVGFALAPTILASGGYAYTTSVSDLLRLVLGSGLYLAALTVIGLALGTLLRNVVASVLSVLALMLVLPFVPQIFSSAGVEITRFFPVQAGSRLLSQTANGELAPWAGFAVLVAWVIAATVAAEIVLKRRDA